MNLFEKTEALLLNKKYSELDSSEQSFILERMTAAEYKEQRMLLIATDKLSAIELPAPPSSQVILNNMNSSDEVEERNQQPEAISSSNGIFSWKDRLAALLNIKIPAWQVGLMAIIVGIMLYPIFDRDKVNTDVVNPYVAIIDTVSEHLINPMLNNKDSNNFFAIGAKLIDSNYTRASNYNRRRQQKDVHTEMLLSLTPIEL